MEPRIQYAKTSDGVSIAFWTLGEGMPLVVMPDHPFSHIQIEWQIPEIRRWYERLAQERMLVRYDSRGTGLSARKVADCSLDALVLDLESVVDRLDLERFALLTSFRAVPAAIAYAARHPERVSQLVLWRPWARASDVVSRSTQAQAVLELMEKDWGLFREMTPRFIFGWGEGELTRRFIALMRESVTEETGRAAIRAMLEFDVTALLPQVRSPTLVLHGRQMPYPDVETVSELVSQIPDARLTLLERESGAPYLGDTEAVAQAIDEFLAEGEQVQAATTETAAPGGFRTILFTDVEGSTALTQRLGDEKGREVLREHERITRDVLKAHGGTEVKTMGDGFMASFASVTKAVECAVALQRAFHEANENRESPLARAAGEGPGVRVRIGLNAGEPIEEEGDLFGATVILAARIAASAEGAEILASDVVRQLCAGKGFLFADRGEHALRGFEDPVRIFEVRWRDES